jgi:alkanesulfonate monooxygenase SsuD/methylene tetrahydromethanopterin reductase-like flavin-dependent oxidoreductase (luciferase family)
MLDHLCDGRLVSGFVRGIGWEYFGHSVNPVLSRERFNEALDLIVKAWTTGELFEWWGEHYEFRYVNIWPRCLQEPHPPIYIPGVGSTETMKFCAQRGYTYMSVYSPMRMIKRWFDGYRAACEEEGYEPEPERIGYAAPIYVAETHEAARAEARQHLEWLFHKGLKQGAEIVWPPGYMSPGSLKGILTSGMKPFPELSYEELIEEKIVVVGSPESVTEQLEEMRQELGFGQLMALMCIGDMPHHRVVRTMELFIKEVAPNFRAAAAEPAVV